MGEQRDLLEQPEPVQRGARRVLLREERPIASAIPRSSARRSSVPVGTGLLIAGGNRNIIKNNRIWDNWRAGVMQFWVPSSFRGTDPTGSRRTPGPAYEAQTDTPNGNRCSPTSWA